jgi:hypothetical protein
MQSPIKPTYSQIITAAPSVKKDTRFWTRTFISRWLAFFLWLDSLIWAWASSFRRGFMITHIRHATVGRTPLDEGPARRRDLTTYNTHKRQTSMPPVGFSFSPVRGFPPFDPFLYCLNLFVLHVTLRSILPSLQQTQHKAGVGYILFPVPVFPFEPFCTFKYFRPSSWHLWSILVLVQQTTKTSMPPAGFEPTMPVSERPKTHALDRMVIGIGLRVH